MATYQGTVSCLPLVDPLCHRPTDRSYSIHIMPTILDRRNGKLDRVRGHYGNQRIWPEPRWNLCDCVFWHGGECDSIRSTDPNALMYSF